MQSVGSKKVELVLSYITSRLKSGTLKTGDKLPPERKLSEALGVSRLHVRRAILKLEAYGIVQILPQSGTVICSTDSGVIGNMISDMIKLSHYDFVALAHTRILLELETVKLCARNRTDEDLREIERLLKVIESKLSDKWDLATDFEFHCAVARGGHNSVMAALLAGITPNVLAGFPFYYDMPEQYEGVRAEHRDIFEKIRLRDEQGAVEALKRNLSPLYRILQDANATCHFLP